MLRLKKPTEFPELMNLYETKQSINDTRLVPLTMRKELHGRVVWCFLGSIFVIFCTAFVLDEQFKNANPKVLCTLIRNDLKRMVLHQDDAVTVVLHTLDYVNQWTSRVYVMPFVGPSGVGKTFITDLIKDHFDPRLVFELTSGNFRDKVKQDDIIPFLRVDVINLLIIEDLTMTDFESVRSLIEKLPIEKYVLVIPIFGIQEAITPTKYRLNKHHVNGIRDLFDKSDLHYNMVVFYPFKAAVINDWLSEQFEKRNVTVEKRERIREFVRNSIDVPNTGLKGAEAKFSLALRMF